MIVENSANCEDGGKTVVREIVPFEVESIMIRMRKWIDESLEKGKECLQIAKETKVFPTNITRRRTLVELINLAKKIVQEFFQIPIPITKVLVEQLVKGLQKPGVNNVGGSMWFERELCSLSSPTDQESKLSGSAAAVRYKCMWDYIELGEKYYQDMDRLATLERGMRAWANWVDTNIDRSKTKVFFLGISLSHTKYGL
ncbi:hypothetical protein VNO78_17053 [Psophocarpus tetragonolobus]|uniref:Uncharacterized protein n=1 Tax=Psophocarpus tetragonolobus TaxID=3891 RepID=A0AAN9SGF2_PSOTE